VRISVDSYGEEQARQCIQYMNESQYGVRQPGLSPTFKLGNIGAPLYALVTHILLPLPINVITTAILLGD
jgi:hypothetical protein